MSNTVAVRTPAVGDKILVRHRTKVNKKGEVALEVCRGHVDVIRQVMLDGWVTTRSGDLWEVKRSAESNADWVSVR